MPDSQLITLQAMTAQLPMLGALQQAAQQPQVLDDRPEDTGLQDPDRGQILDIRV